MKGLLHPYCLTLTAELVNHDILYALDALAVQPDK